jgi:hypothetical protein
MRREVVLAIVLLAVACSAGDPVETSTAAEAPSTTTATALATTTTAAPASTAPASTVPASTVAEATSTTVDASLVVSGAFSPAFTMRVPDGTFLSPGISEGNFREWTGPNDSWILFHRGSNTIEAWAENFRGAGATPTEVEGVTVGGKPGEMFEATPARTFQLLPGRFLEDGDATRVYVVDVDGERVSILGVTDPEHFSGFTGMIDEMLSTLEWVD